jgi:hypothetical protein
MHAVTPSRLLGPDAVLDEEPQETESTQPRSAKFY